MRFWHKAIFPVFLLPVLFFFACGKNNILIATYTLSTTNPHTGETIHCTDVTQDADSYEWYIDGNFYSGEKQPDFVFQQAGTYRIKLVVKAKRHEDSSIEKQLTVDRKGKAVFWQSSANFVNTVNIVMIPGGSLTTGLGSAPSCGDAGAFTIELAAPDTVNYTAYELYPGTRTWSGQLVVSENGCTVVELQ